MTLRTRHTGKRTDRGFTYIGILLAVALIGISLAAIGSTWSLQIRRAKEQNLIYVGQAYRRAIASYYRSGPAGVHQYPTSLSDLISDPRTPELQRHLRQLYADPMTGSADWRLVKTLDGVIIGVASQSNQEPLKRANFDVWEADFENAACICDWEFVFLPQLIHEESGQP
ncbi:MAG: type II secretion system GspH family protein [Gammaproteobacteria bacterium]|nr:type II secretion system GspH family protein [Gammaproteobacteria bacterium]